MTLQGQDHDDREASKFDDLQEVASKDKLITKLNAKLQATKREYAAYRKKVDTKLQNKHQDVAATKPLDRFDPDVKRDADCNVLKKHTVTSNCSCSFSTSIHVPPDAFFKALTNDHASHVTNKMLYQEVVKRLSEGETVVFWSYMLDQVKSCDLTLRLKVKRSDDDEIMTRVSSVREEDVVHVHTQVEVGQVMKDSSIVTSQSTVATKAMTSTKGGFVTTSSKQGASKKLDFWSEDDKASDLFSKIATQFYKRFKKEGVIDEMMKEECVLEKGKATIAAIESSSDLKVIPSGDPLVTGKVAHVEGDIKLLTGVIESVMDGEIEELAAFECLKMSREATKNFHEKGGVKKTVEEKEGENKMIVCYEDTDALDKKHPRDPNVLAASARSIWEYERLPEVEGIPQIRVRLVSRVDIAGSIPTFIMNRLTKNYAKSLINMKKKFDKSLEINAGQRAGIMKKIKLQEEAGGAKALAQFKALSEEKQGSERPSRKFELADSNVQANAVGSKGWGSTSVNVRAEMEEVAAIFWDFGSRANIAISGDVESTFEEDEEGAGGFRKIVKRHQQCRVAMAVITVIVHLRVKYGRATVVARGSVSVGNAGAIEASETVAILLRRLDGGMTKLEFACEIELGFGVSQGAAKHFVERRLGEIIGVSIYFQRLVRLKEYREADGVALGNDLLWTAPSAKKRVERLKEVLTRSRAMREPAETLPWFETMMVIAVRGNLNLNKAVRTKMVCVSEKEAIRIGKNLRLALKSRKVIGAGVDQWRLQNPAVGELMDEHNLVEPMIIVISKGIVKTAVWGLMWRVTLGAVLSLGDLVKDLIVLKRFWKGGDEMMACRDATLACLTTSIVLQLMVVAIQNRKKGVLRILKETMIVVTRMKSAVDACRVASGAEKEKDTQIDPMLDMTFSKLIEIFTKSIPGIIIQTSAIISELNSGDPTSSMTYISLLVSSMTTGFVSATLSYDYDTDPKKRAFNPEFYGYVPDDARKRAALFVTMTLMSADQVLIHGISVVILGSIARSYALLYLVGNMVLYFIYKVVRGDLRHWLPLYGLTGSVI
ncbi:hypothetical protein TL16_g13231 [Triparma laevis f. inornata]|uniref:Uncharacterized protein n=1 Tax=Triparma laevis f. inornata TaxID=1714386 RepID=A0A9W7BSS3_9STRA|nr:hypothetical protein TL16_g13231 [Triparma laevis f. inornata]